MYNGDGDDLDSACQQIGRTKGSDSCRKITAHHNPNPASQRSLLHGQRQDYPRGGPDLISHERSDRVPQNLAGGYTDAAFPPPQRWDGDRKWNSDRADGAERTGGRPAELDGGVEMERERFARRSGAEIDANEPRKALANGGSSVHAGVGVRSHERSLSGSAQSGEGFRLSAAAARRGERLSSSSAPRQHGDGGGRRGVWAGASRGPSRLAGDRGSERGAVDGGSRLGNQQRFGSGARGEVEGDRNGGVAERPRGRDGEGGGGRGGGIADSSGGGRFHGWSERKRPLESLDGVEDGTRGSPKKVILDSVGQSSWCYSSYSPARS